ncbi:MAG: four-helix bundle copper-binding protein [Ramlibacter sp.]
MPHQKHLSCIEACHACAVACNHCASSCLQEQDVKMMARCIAVDMDCAAICQLAVAAMARGSEHAKAICGLCADICQSCGDECAEHEMEHCQQCAKACHQCAQECGKMAAMA